MKTWIVSVAIGVCALASAHGANEINASVISGCGTLLRSEKVNGKWEIEFEVTSGNVNCFPSFSVMGNSNASAEHIRYIRVHKPFGTSFSRLYVGNLTNLGRIGSIDEIRGFDAFGPDLLSDLHIREIFSLATWETTRPARRKRDRCGAARS